MPKLSLCSHAGCSCAAGHQLPAARSLTPRALRRARQQKIPPPNARKTGGAGCELADAAKAKTNGDRGKNAGGREEGNGGGAEIFLRRTQAAVNSGDRREMTH
ncbi:hypothetical protein GUJ93_ZPchr0002g25635 [Zizania palustris]|uniref:Uncharacterized protein n=1 Tax=Zizania palustris TaxID=103762 RepID=A0A8J5S9K6_ZIZPA|nr:hypothetical protein GUJ93_ZPchr0002g25635 [Zizania palustris]